MDAIMHVPIVVDTAFKNARAEFVERFVCLRACVCKNARASVRDTTIEMRWICL